MVFYIEKKKKCGAQFLILILCWHLIDSATSEFPSWPLKVSNNNQCKTSYIFLCCFNQTKLVTCVYISTRVVRIIVMNYQVIMIKSQSQSIDARFFSVFVCFIAVVRMLIIADNELSVIWFTFNSRAKHFFFIPTFPRFFDCVLW